MNDTNNTKCKTLTIDELMAQESTKQRTQSRYLRDRRFRGEQSDFFMRLEVLLATWSQGAVS